MGAIKNREAFNVVDGRDIEDMDIKALLRAVPKSYDDFVYSTADPPFLLCHFIHIVERRG